MAFSGASPAGPPPGFLEGKLLIAMPGMSDPRFEQAVLYMCAHSSEGAMGIMLNKRIEGLAFGGLMEKLGIDVTDARAAPAPVFFGGPVETGRGFVLHSADYAGRDQTLTLQGGFALTTTLDILRAISDGSGPSRMLMALGYAGWGEGQIEDEILANGWLHCDADPAVVFDADASQKWRMAIARLGIDPSGLSAAAGRA